MAFEVWKDLKIGFLSMCDKKPWFVYLAFATGLGNGRAQHSVALLPPGTLPLMRPPASVPVPCWRCRRLLRMLDCLFASTALCGSHLQRQTGCSTACSTPLRHCEAFCASSINLGVTAGEGHVLLRQSSELVIRIGLCAVSDISPSTNTTLVVCHDVRLVCGPDAMNA
jgi:hypothetical protein